MDPPPVRVSQCQPSIDTYLSASISSAAFFGIESLRTPFSNFAWTSSFFTHITNIEASACAAGITFTADIIAFLVFLVFVKTLGSGDGKITILQAVPVLHLS